jgi:hypothetical protein
MGMETEFSELNIEINYVTNVEIDEKTETDM